MSRGRAFVLGFEYALVGFAIALLLVLGLAGRLPVGTRAQAAGACVALLGAFIGALLLGLRARRHGSTVPWAAVLGSGLTLAGLGIVCLILPSATDWAGGVARGTVFGVVARTLALGVPALAIGVIGTALGVHADRRALPASLIGTALLFALQLGAWKLARAFTYNPHVIEALTIAGATLAFLIVGFGLAFAMRRLAFVELVTVSLLYGFSSYLGLTLFTERLLESIDVPQEQVLVGLAFAPSGIGVCLLAVGASVGFLLMGSGRLDASFSYEFGVALRYLRAQTRSIGATPQLGIPRHRLFRRFLALVARPGASVGIILTVSVMGVSLGVLALIVVLSVMSGFEDDLKQKILGAHSHAVINKTGDDFEEYQALEEKIRDVDGVVSVAAFVLGEGMVTSDSNISGALIKGIDPQNEDATATLRRDLRRGSIDHLLHPELIVGARPRFSTETTTTATSSAGAPFDPSEPKMKWAEPLRSGRVYPGIVIGRELAHSLRVQVGDLVKLVSPVSDEIGPTGPQPKLRQFRVAGIFYSGMFEFDAKFGYIEMKKAQQFFGMRSRATGVELRVSEVDDTPRIVEEVKRRIGGYPYRVRDWREMNKELFSALLLEKLAMFIILVFIVLVASFNIVSTLVMIVLEKGREIAILKSMGATEASIMKIFVVQGLIVGVGGAVLGLLTGVGICLLIQKFGIDLDPDVFYIDRLPVVMDWTEISLISAAAIVITYLATIYPAMAAAQLNPVEGLRDD